MLNNKFLYWLFSKGEILTYDLDNIKWFKKIIINDFKIT